MSKWSWLFWWRPPCVLRTVIVNLHDETIAIKGVLWQSRGPWLVIRQAHVLRAGIPPTPTDGEVVVERCQVAFLQVLPLVEGLAS